MPHSSPPDPSGRSSARRAVPPASPAGSSARKAAETDPDAPAPTTAPAPLEAVLNGPPGDEAPTIISSNRPRNGPDAQLAESLAGRRLGHFELLESIGVGGMAAVIKARDLDLGRTVALKILPPDMAVDPENITRFKQEARAAARLDHENIARVYFCGEDQGLHFIAFEFVEGENLRCRTEKQGGTLPVGECLGYLVQVAAGLGHAASRGVVHRDIKPSNIIITPEGKAKIVDMGLARNLDPHAANGAVTQSGVTLGTFDYISPEQAIEPRLADVRSDIYSLGCTFYHVLTGDPPVPEGTAAKKLHAHQHVPPPDPRELNPAVPDELAAVLGRMMAKDPDQRYQHPEPLIQHLLAVAEKLRLPVGPVTHDSALAAARAEPPLPEPPGLTAPWVVAGVAVLLVGAAALTGGFNLGGREPIDSPPLWTDSQPAPKPAADEPVATARPGPADAPARPAVRQAANVAQLVEALRQETAEVLLTGDVYDLTAPAKLGEAPPEALFRGQALTLRGQNPAKLPVVRLRPAAPDDDSRAARPGALTVRGAGAGRQVTVKFNDIRFEVAPGGAKATAPPAAISLRGVDRFEADGCWFDPVSPDAAEPNGPADVHLFGRSEGAESPAALFRHCYFGPGAVGFRATGPVQVSASQCALGPHAAVFQVRGVRDADEPVGPAAPPALVKLDHCSARLGRGALVEVGDRVPCKVVAGQCLFAGEDASLEGTEPEAVLVRQVGARDPATSYEGVRGGGRTPMDNGYHAVAVYRDEQQQAVTFGDCEEAGFRAQDAGARPLAESPWVSDRSVEEAGRENARSAFQVNLNLGPLRLPAYTGQRVLGVEKWLRDSLYISPLPKLAAESRLADNQKVWQPELPAGPAPAGVYRTLPEALAAVRPGDELLLRFNGLRDVQPHVFTRGDLKLTIKADAGYKPVLGLLKTVQPFLFKLSEGVLAFDNVQFRLRPDRGRQVVALPGGGRCLFRNCVLTLEDGDGAGLSAVTLSDPAAEMMMMGSSPDKLPVPAVSFERCFIRGKGRLLHVRGSRPFELDVKDSLVVLDGTLVDVDPTAADLTGAGPAYARLSQVTAYLGGPLVRLQANSKGLDSKGPGLVPTHVHAEGCLIAPAAPGGTPLVRLDRVENESQMAALFFWDDPRDNYYGYPRDKEVLKIQPESAEAMPLKTFDADAWLGRWREPERSFTPFRFPVQPESGAGFTNAQRLDFQLPADALPKSEDHARPGAPIDSLPQPVEGL